MANSVIYPVTEESAQQTFLSESQYREMYARSLRDPKNFWSEQADKFITYSGGHREERYVIKTPIVLANQSWPIEITLTERDTMLFRMLLGRSAIRKCYLVNPARSFIRTKMK